MAQSKSSAGGGSASCSTEQTGMIATPNPGGFRPSGEPLNLWDAIDRVVPGGDAWPFFDGVAHGEVIGELYLRALGSGKHGAGALGSYLIALIERGAGGVRLDDVRRGRIVGMCAALDPWLQYAVSVASPKKNLTDADLLAKMQDAEDGGPSRRTEAEHAEERSRYARAAANARWAKHRATKQENSRV